MKGPERLTSKQPGAGLERLLKLPASLYGAITGARNVAYDRKIFASFDVGCPVVSVGNITAGGTGKTAVVAMLVEGLLERGLKPGIVSRGYGGTEKGPARVLPGEPRRFGDEPSWFAARFPSVPVFIGGDRVMAAQKLLSHQRCDLLIADDGFQHRRLARSFDIVILDATEPAWHYRPLPLGRLREGFESLARANAIFITKTNLASTQAVSWLKQQAGIENASKIHELESKITGFDGLGGGSTSLNGEKVFLFSGIGRPGNFEKSVAETAEVAGHRVFRDHHSYSQKDLAEIESAAAAAGAVACVTTEKDAVKLREWKPGIPVWVSRLETRPKNGDLKELYEAIGRTLR